MSSAPLPLPRPVPLVRRATPEQLGELPPIREETLRGLIRTVTPVLRRWFRAEARGVERLPAGQTIVVGHHDGGVMPWNGLVLGCAWYERFGLERPLYVLAHDILHSISKRAGRFLSECGVIRADRRAMDTALGAGVSVMVFPGAARETFRPYWRRRDIDLGGRTGFVAQAIRWGVPITPVVSAGSHETVIVLASGSNLARRIGLPRLIRSADVLPLQAGLPWGIWALPFLPPLPLPAKITAEVLEPIDLAAALGRRLVPADADDPAIVQAGYRLVVGRMRAALGLLYAERRWPILG